MSTKKMYKVLFYNQEEVFELYAAHVYPSDMLGFVEVDELTFGERSQVVVDPGQEKLRKEFEGVKKTWIPVNAIIRIDEVEASGHGPVSTVKAGVTPLRSRDK
ncbi:DUF1820 family protein [Marinobacteraceae bacterium S3BR75-40.1]